MCDWLSARLICPNLSSCALFWRRFEKLGLVASWGEGPPYKKGPGCSTSRSGLWIKDCGLPLGLFTWMWETSGRWGLPPCLGNQSIRTVRWGTPPRRVTRSACPGNPLIRWGEFPMWKLRSEVTRLTGVIKSLERGELFRRFHLQNRQNADEIDSAGDNLNAKIGEPG